jgi:hypothetical protein
MKCLSKVEVQEYIDKEVDEATNNERLIHLESCSRCSSLYNEAVEDKVLINIILNATISEDKTAVVPEFKLPVTRRKRENYFRLVVLVAASVICFILLIPFDKEPVTEKIPEAEILMYEFYDGKDLNKMWHDKSQILIIEDGKGNVIQSIITY